MIANPFHTQPHCAPGINIIMSRAHEWGFASAAYAGRAAHQQPQSRAYVPSSPYLSAPSLNARGGSRPVSRPTTTGAWPRQIQWVCAVAGRHIMPALDALGHGTQTQQRCDAVVGRLVLQTRQQCKGALMIRSHSLPPSRCFMVVVAVAADQQTATAASTSTSCCAALGMPWLGAWILS